MHNPPNPPTKTKREGAKMVDLFNKTMDIPTRTYEVYGFDAFKFKVQRNREGEGGGYIM